MTTKEKQLKFWSALKKSDQKLFDGTPHKLQYYDIVNKSILPLKIRLDIYCKEEDYTKNGYLTLCILLPEGKLKSIEKKLKGNANKVEDHDGRLFLLRTFDESCLITDNPSDWESAINWFKVNTKAILSIIK